MPVEINNESGAKAGTADKDYFLDSDGNVTEDPQKAATLLIRAGQDVPKEMADKYGIGKVAQSEETAKAGKAKAPAAAPEKETDSKTVSEKAATPAKNKAKAPAKNK